MLLLAYDTSGREGSIALAQCEEAACSILDQVAVSGGTFSAQLIPQTAELLHKHGFSANDIGALVVASGPGTFTGLRIGLAASKGLAEALQKPIAAVSVLQAMVWDVADGPVLAAIDASRSEVYVGEYRDRGRTMVRELLLPQAEFVALVQAKASTVVACDEPILALMPQAKSIVRPQASDFARIGWAKLQNGETVLVDELDANYIRRTDAELLAKLQAG
jgi:tRNA threonylcarbamoyladenosine biosynthesis protein TsaB